MNICYFSDIKPLECLHVLERLDINIGRCSELIIENNVKSILESLDNKNILVIRDFDQLGSSFSEIFNNLHYLAERGVTLVCLNQEKKYSAACAEYSFLSDLYNLKRAKTEKIQQMRLDTIKRKNSKPGRQPLYSKEVAIMVSSLKGSTNLSVEEICRRVGISKSTYYKYFNKVNI